MALTKYQIKNQIDTLTYDKNNYINQRDKYKNSLNYANNLVADLKKSVDYLTKSNDNMKNYFTIDKNTADDGKIKNVIDKIDKIIKKFNNTIIPEIKSNINYLDNEVSDLNYRINVLWGDYYKAQS